MTRRTFRLGWLVAVLATTALACTCGVLGQANSVVETAQSLATAGQELATAAQGFATQGAEIATQLATTGAIETLQAQATYAGPPVSAGGGPEDVPVYPGSGNVAGSEEALIYTSSATAQEIIDFYIAEMPNNGWTATQDPVVSGPSTALTYTKDNREITLTVTEFGGQVTVAAGTTTK